MLLPHQHLVTKAGAYGNEVPAFFRLADAGENRKPLFYNALIKLARHLLYLWHNNNNKQRQDNKNKTYRLQHNNDNNAEAQLTDSFGKELPLGLAPQPDREQ